MSEVNRPHVTVEQPLRLIAIDDDPDWCELFADNAAILGHTLDTAYSLEEARFKIRLSEDEQRHYAVALIDMNFETGKHKTSVPRGKEAIKYIKSQHPYIACIVVSGTVVTPDSVLDLRDEYDLDYYVQKDRFDVDIFAKALRRAILRVQSEGETGSGRSLQKAVADHAARREQLIHIRETIVASFSEGEFRTLCFDLGIEYGDLPGDGKLGKARELVAFLNRHGRFSELVAVIRRMRPHVNWEEIVS